MNSIAGKTLRLVQFNVENLFLFLDLYRGQELDKVSETEWKKFSSSVTPNKSLYKTRALAKVIKEIDPDILMLNEVGGSESLENFNKYFLNAKYKCYLKEGNSNRGIDVGYLVRAELDYKFVHISHKNRPLNFLYPHQAQTPAGGKSHYFSRDVSELRIFKPTDTSPQLVILLTHLKSKLDADGVDAQGKLRRAAELKALVSIYNDVRNELGSETAIIVAGDFNGIASPHNTEPEFTPLYEATDLTDAMEVINKPLDERYTQVQIMPSGQQHFLQLDYQFVSPYLRDKISAEESYVYRFKSDLGLKASVPKNLEERALLPSDHYPVVITLKG